VLKCDYNFNIPYAVMTQSEEDQAKHKCEYSENIKSVEMLVEQRWFSMAIELIRLALPGKSQDNESKITLLSFLAYCICYLENPNKAEAILSKVTIAELDWASTAAYCQYYLAYAWCLIALGERDRARKALLLVDAHFLNFRQIRANCFKTFLRRSVVPHNNRWHISCEQ